MPWAVTVAVTVEVAVCFWHAPSSTVRSIVHVPVRVGDKPDVERLKILAARVAPECPAGGALAKVGKAVLLPCADGSALELLKVQPANRKPMDAAAYWNGLRGDACTPAA